MKLSQFKNFLNDAGLLQGNLQTSSNKVEEM